MNVSFIMDRRLGIPLPFFQTDWDSLSLTEQEKVLEEWERIRSRIPDRIKELEQLIREKQSQLNHEEDFGRSCRLNAEISELASIINDLNIWFRVNQELADPKALP